MQENILHKFELVVYPRIVWIAVNCTDSFLKEAFKEEIPPLENRLDAYVCNTENGVLVRFSNASCMTVQVIAHESTHAALYVFDYMGCKIDYNNQEPIAFLIDCISNFCDEVKKTIN